MLPSTSMKRITTSIANQITIPSILTLDLTTHLNIIIKQLPKSINNRLSALSSDEKSFKASAPLYETTTSNSSTLINKKRSTQNSNPKWKRNIIWFNPLYSKNIRTNVAHKFLALIDKHFPKLSVLHKIFNRNSVKVSYSCMPNAKSNISNHNCRVLNNKMTSINEKTCSCRAESKCPLDGKCLTTSIVYKAEITPTDALTHAKYAKETELSKYAWNLKETGRLFTIKWSIIKCVPAYIAGGRSCNLCLEEKLLIMKSNKEKTLNKRSELFAKCRHKKSSARRTLKARVLIVLI